VTVKNNFGLLGIKDLKDLFLIRLGITLDIRMRHFLTKFITPRRIADLGRKVTYQKNNTMAERLELLHFAKQNHMP